MIKETLAIIVWLVIISMGLTSFAYIGVNIPKDATSFEFMGSILYGLSTAVFSFCLGGLAAKLIVGD